MKSLRPDWFENPNIRKFKKGDEFTFVTTYIMIFDGYNKTYKGYEFHSKDDPNLKGIFRKTYKESNIIHPKL